LHEQRDMADNRSLRPSCPERRSPIEREACAISDFRMDRSFILTAELDPTSFEWLDGLRRKHFPPERNLLPAHLTLFHRLSWAQTNRLDEAAIPSAPIHVLYDGVRLLGAGVAIETRSPELERLRAALHTAMAGEFSRQDSQTWRPHVTIQNKVPITTARELHDELQTKFEARAGAIHALLVWEFLGGPWRPAGRLPFG
jgi:2'-5' RNA ligase